MEDVVKNVKDEDAIDASHLEENGAVELKPDPEEIEKSTEGETPEANTPELDAVLENSADEYPTPRNRNSAVN